MNLVTTKLLTEWDYQVIHRIVGLPRETIDKAIRFIDSFDESAPLPTAEELQAAMQLRVKLAKMQAGLYEAAFNERIKDVLQAFIRLTEQHLHGIYGLSPHFG